MSTSKFAGALFALILATLASPAVAAERIESDFVEACTASNNLSPAVCECSAKKAKAELTPGGYSLLVAMLEGNDAAAAQCAKESPASD